MATEGRPPAAGARMAVLLALLSLQTLRGVVPKILRQFGSRRACTRNNCALALAWKSILGREPFSPQFHSVRCVEFQSGANVCLSGNQLWPSTWAARALNIYKAVSAQ